MDVTTQRMSSGTEAKSALIANKEHQAAMKAYIEQLEGELDSLDQLLVRNDNLTRLCYESSISV
jgi:hypothetical protein